MRRFLCLLLLVSRLFCPGLLLADEMPEKSSVASIDFLYINANAGEAAGGHTALRLGDAVFHYQFFPDGTFLLVREPWDSFLFLYNELHNRSISIASLPLNFSAAKQIRNHFAELLAEQEHFFRDLEQLYREKRFFQRLLADSFEQPVEALGFFSKQGQSPHLVGLVKRIETTLGAGFLQQLLNEAESKVEQEIVAINRGKRRESSFQEILALREALRVLSENRGLGRLACVPSMQEERSLIADEKVLLKIFSDYLTESIGKLLQSKRPDSGSVILLQTARYLAIQHSLASGRLLTLDPFFEGIRDVQLSREETGDGRLGALQETLLRQSATRRDLFFEEKLHPEIAYSLLETSRARAWELQQVNDVQRSVRILAKVTLPTRPGVVGVAALKPDPEVLHTNLELLEKALEVERKRSKELYGYNLFTRNCATELIRSLNSTFPDSGSGKAVLGAWMEPESGLAFIPFLFYEQSVNAFSLQDEQFIQARRLRNLEILYKQESDLLVWLRESNTLSSTLYQPRSKDTPFLFFTDDSLLLRPVFGIMNVLYGTAYSVAGIVNLPFDGGEHLNQALRGVFYSLPELTFGNIRKGSYSTGENSTDH